MFLKLIQLYEKDNLIFGDWLENVLMLEELRLKIILKSYIFSQNFPPNTIIDFRGFFILLPNILIPYQMLITAESVSETLF